MRKTIPDLPFKRRLMLGRACKSSLPDCAGCCGVWCSRCRCRCGKETVPALVKFLLVVLLIMIVIPMVVFTALPNIFFGYDSSDTASVIHMTEQAMRYRRAYMSLDDFERTQIDSIVTGIAAEYEADGTAIDHIEVKNTMKEDDLLWIIAINSAAYEQDLDAMSAELIQNFCQSTLSYQPSLSLLGGSTSATLEVEIKRIDPEELMEQMGFNEDARQWAGALFETLKDSGALEKYGGYFSAYQPDYSGDGSYSGDIQHGTSYDNDIDISRFVSPSTKNNLDLAAYAVQAWENNWGYVWGTYGNILTESLFAYKKQQYPDGVGNYADFIEANWLGRRTADCIGLIKGYAWLDASTMLHRLCRKRNAGLRCGSDVSGGKECRHSRNRLRHGILHAGNPRTDVMEKRTRRRLYWRRLRNRSHGNAKRCCENRSQRTRLAGVV